MWTSKDSKRPPTSFFLDTASSKDPLSSLKNLIDPNRNDQKNAEMIIELAAKQPAVIPFTASYDKSYEILLKTFGYKVSIKKGNNDTKQEILKCLLVESLNKLDIDSTERLIELGVKCEPEQLNSRFMIALEELNIDALRQLKLLGRSATQEQLDSVFFSILSLIESWLNNAFDKVKKENAEESDEEDTYEELQDLLKDASDLVNLLGVEPKKQQKLLDSLLSKCLKYRNPDLPSSFFIADALDLKEIGAEPNQEEVNELLSLVLETFKAGNYPDNDTMEIILTDVFHLKELGAQADEAWLSQSITEAKEAGDTYTEDGLIAARDTLEDGCQRYFPQDPFYDEDNEEEPIRPGP